VRPQGLHEIQTIHSYAEKARIKPNTEALQTDRQTQRNDTHCLRPVLSAGGSALPAWSERLWGESREVSFRDNPLHGVEGTLGHPSPPQLSPGSSSSAARSHPAKTLRQPQPRRLGLGCAAGSHRSPPASPRSPPHRRASPPPHLTHLAAEPQLLPRRRWGTAPHGRRMPKAGREHLGAGGGGGECLRKRSLLSPSVCRNKASACIVLIGSSEV